MKNKVEIMSQGEKIVLDKTLYNDIAAHVRHADKLNAGKKILETYLHGSCQKELRCFVEEIVENPTKLEDFSDWVFRQLNKRLDDDEFATAESYTRNYLISKEIEKIDDARRINVSSPTNAFMSVTFVVSSKDYEKSCRILKNAWDEFWDDENTDACFGEFLESFLVSAGIKFSSLYVECDEFDEPLDGEYKRLEADYYIN